ncbi:MAG: nucleotide exchange factor GrpE, partial [Zoogloeaceae bacterium]|nr:nucleotide exchange factor GrpE [Zoogloeaceae bacterium]
MLKTMTHTHPADAPSEEPKAMDNPPPADAVEAPETVDPDIRIAELEAQVAELNDHWLRAKAEAENARRRAAEEVV